VERKSLGHQRCDQTGFLAYCMRRKPATISRPVPKSRRLVGSGVDMGSENVTCEALVMVRLPNPVVTQPSEQLNSGKLPTPRGPTGAKGLDKL